MANQHSDNDSPPTAPPELTATQRRILELARSGLTNQQIAAATGTTRNAVRFHLKNLHAVLDTGGDRRALEQHDPGPVRRLIALVAGLLSPEVAATAAVAAISVAGFAGIRAAYSRVDDAPSNSRLGPRSEVYCFGKMSTPMSTSEERCFRSEAEALAYETVMNEP